MLTHILAPRTGAETRNTSPTPPDAAASPYDRIYTSYAVGRRTFAKRIDKSDAVFLLGDGFLMKAPGRRDKVQSFARFKLKEVES